MDESHCEDLEKGREGGRTAVDAIDDPISLCIWFAGGEGRQGSRTKAVNKKTAD
jgi:hypothetical protein